MNDSRPERSLQVQKNNTKSRRRQAQRNVCLCYNNFNILLVLPCLFLFAHIQLFMRRSKHVKPTESTKWGEITYHFMSEESGEEDHITRHTLPWRSEGN